MIVMKFGGSSVESAVAIRRVVDIVRAYSNQQPVVVVSAMGQTTNRLLAIAHEAAEGNNGLALQELNDLEEYHLYQVRSLLPPLPANILAQQIAQQFNELTAWVGAVAVASEVTPFLADAILSFGERLSSEIVSAALESAEIRAQHLDARRLVVTNNRHTQATPLLWETYAKIRRAIPHVAQERVVVLGGFIGANEAGETTTLGRGGSDWTASLVGAAIQADEIQIWTDVDGMLTCDPRLLAGGFCLRSLSYAEAAEMARLGAKVLHPATVEPAVSGRIPLSIRNSRRPEAEGTQISRTGATGIRGVKSVTSKTPVTLLQIQSGNNKSLDSLAEETFCRFQTAVEWLMPAEGSLLAVTDDPTHLPAIVAAFEPYATVAVERHQALVGLVGEGVGSSPVFLRQAMAALTNARLAVRTWGQGPLSWRFVVPQEDLIPAVTCLHNAFFRLVDPALFSCETAELKSNSLPAREAEQQEFSARAQFTSH